MASAKAKNIRDRLEQIKALASAQNAAALGGDTPAALAEEAAELGLELHDILTAKKEK